MKTNNREQNRGEVLINEIHQVVNFVFSSCRFSKKLSSTILVFTEKKS